MTRRFRFWRLSGVLVATATWLGCAPEPAQQEEPVILETEDVDLGPDVEIDLSGDQKAPPRRASSGRLPSDFPAELPIFQPSSISDIGEGGLGGLVQFLAQAKPAVVRDWYRGALTGGGWSVELSEDGAMVASLGARRARISVEAAGPGSTITVQY